MKEKQIFDVLLEKHENMEATGITLPFDVEDVFGAKRVPVKVTINGVENRTTIFRMNGQYRLPVPKKFRDEAAIKAGDKITVELERDTELRVIELTADLALALSENSAANEAWNKLSFTHKKEYVRALEESKRPETRARRLQKTIEALEEIYNKKK